MNESCPEYEMPHRTFYFYYRWLKVNGCVYWSINAIGKEYNQDRPIFFMIEKYTFPFCTSRVGELISSGEVGRQLWSFMFSSHIEPNFATLKLLVILIPIWTDIQYRSGHKPI